MSLKKNLKVVIIGSGNVGCFLGAHLMRLPHVQVLLLGRSRIKKVINDAGKLTIYPSAGGMFSFPADSVPYTTSPKDIKTMQPDIVFVTLKGTQIKQAFTEFGQNAQNNVFPDHTLFVILQNGVRSLELVRAMVPNNLVISGSVPYNIVMSDDAVVYQATSGIISLEKTDQTHLITSMLKESGLSSEVRANIKGIMYGKLAINTNNAINALSGLTLLEEFSDYHFRKLWGSCISECLATYKAAGIKPISPFSLPLWIFPYFLELPNSFVLFLLVNFFKIKPWARSSMQDDFVHRRQTEIHQLNGEVVGLAAKYKTNAKTLRGLVWLIEEVERRQKALLGGSDWKPKLNGEEILSYIEDGIKENYPF